MANPTSNLQTELREHADECEAVAKERAKTEGNGLHYMNTCEWAYAAAFREANREITQLRTDLAAARELHGAASQTVGRLTADVERLAQEAAQHCKRRGQLVRENHWLRAALCRLKIGPDAELPNDEVAADSPAEMPKPVSNPNLPDLRDLLCGLAQMLDTAKSQDWRECWSTWDQEQRDGITAWMLHLERSPPETPRELPIIDAEIYCGNRVIVDCVELTKYVTARIVGPDSTRAQRQSPPDGVPAEAPTVPAALGCAQETGKDDEARKLYNASLGDQHNLHILAWSELTETQRNDWRRRAENGRTDGE